MMSYSITYLAPCRVILRAGLQAVAQPGAWQKVDVGVRIHSCMQIPTSNCRKATSSKWNNGFLKVFSV